MANKTNPRRAANQRNQWKPEIPDGGHYHPDDNVKDDLLWLTSKPAKRQHPHHPEEPRLKVASGCSGEGHNGQKGRSVWKTLSRRSERRAIKNNKVPKVKKIEKRFKAPIEANDE